MPSLDDTDPVCHIQGIIVFAESHVALLQATGCDESVDLLAFNVVQLSHSILDLSLVGLDIDDEDQGVAILNQLHGGLGGQWVLDDGMLVGLALSWCALGSVLGLPGVLKRLGLVEVHSGVNAGALLGNSLLQGLGHCCCFLACIVEGGQGLGIVKPTRRSISHYYTHHLPSC